MLTLWVTAALAGKVERDQRAVEEAFAELTRLGAAFDPAVGELYAAEAQITTVRDGVETKTPVAAIKAALPQLMEMAEKGGDRDTFTEVRVQPHEAQGRWRVTAVRYNEAKCQSDPDYTADFVKVGKEWRVIAERMTLAPKSACPPYPDLAERLAALKAEIDPHLPVQVDDATELRSVTVEGTSLAYGIFLPTVVAGEMPHVQEALRGLALQGMGLDPRLRALVDHGATLAYRFQTAGGETLDVQVANGDCP